MPSEDARADPGAGLVASALPRSRAFGFGVVGRGGAIVTAGVARPIASPGVCGGK